MFIKTKRSITEKKNTKRIMAMRKPYLEYVTRESLNDYTNNRRCHLQLIKTFNSYAELKRSLKSVCEENIDEDGVFVIRQRKGEWGEWFERWDLVNGKPVIIRKGWM